MWTVFLQEYKTFYDYKEYPSARKCKTEIVEHSHKTLDKILSVSCQDKSKLMSVKSMTENHASFRDELFERT